MSSTNNPTYKPSEGKREEFRRYLEKTGVMDALTKVLVSLYEEVDKPDDALDYIRNKLASQAGLETFDQLKTQLEEANNKIHELQTEISTLKGETPGEEHPHEGEAEHHEGEAPHVEGEAAHHEGEAPAPAPEAAPPTE